MIKLSIKNYWPFFLGLFLGIYFISLNVLGKTLLYLPGDLGDTRFVIYLLEHFYQYITGNVDYYWGAPFFVPAPDVLTFSENLLGVAPLFAMFRKLGFDVETSFQFWYLLLVVLNYSSSYVFLNKLFNNKYAAVIGAMLFAFSMALQGQLEHAQTFPRFCIPLALLFATKFIQTFKARYFFLMCSTLVIQMYCTIYLGMMLIIPLLIFLAISLLSHYKDYLKHVTDIKWLGYVLLGLAVNGAALYYLLKPYTQRADRTGYTPWEIVHDNVPRLESYFFSRPGSFLWSAFENTADYLPRFYNQYLFIGGLGILLCTVFILFAIKKIIDNRNSIQSFIQKPIVLLGLTALCTYLLYLRVGDFTLYKGVFSLPGYGSIRAVPRIINIELMFVAIAAAYVLSWFFKSLKKYAALAFVLIAGLLIVDSYYPLNANTKPKLKKADMQARTNELVAKLDRLPAKSIFSYEPDSTDMPIHVYHLDAMMAAQVLQLKTFNGYSGTIPAGYGPYSYEPNEPNRLKWIERSKFHKEVVVIK